LDCGGIDKSHIGCIRKVDLLTSRKKPELEARERFLDICTLCASDILMIPVLPDVQRVEEGAKNDGFVEADPR
jgi:hypothetical protein